MLAKVLQQELNPQVLTYSENDDLKGYLTKLVSKAKQEQNNAFLHYQDKKVIQNIESQIEAMNRYKTKQIYK